MLSRLAENLYWMGRYVERAENTARLLDVNYHAMAEAPYLFKGLVAEQWAPLLTMTGNEAKFRSHFERADRNTVPEWLTLHPDNPGSIRSSLTAARENARTLRDRISSEMWEVLNRAYFTLCAAPQGDEEGMLHDYCEGVREASTLFFGTAEATLPRNEGWYFLEAGRYLERADNVLRILMVRYRQYRGQEPLVRGVETHRSMALLKSISAFEAFRKSFHGALEPRRIVGFLLLDPTFPRSVRFCARALFEALQEIEARNQGVSSEPARLAGWLYARLHYMESFEQITEREDPSMETLLSDFAAISDVTTRAYFKNLPAPLRPVQSQWQQGLGQVQTQVQGGARNQAQSQVQGSGAQSQTQSQRQF
ncbi:alpha-E domain-containing protein [Truepera radiovictrix]|uniref:DUF403 domain-containing protein n=1 Tax=Truepera radiovictrix (strain DSM 17093 / CIP 108686 / LMG 22925 / RQ-24) TaxID=649638 RepID=D7CQX7_TRURR|nr:alpha-E domain-containing protein [Truepera radiovictrix]ADI15111.1 protein of unknown function DUF403 [Truepera radiovictrix DSM 17093]WMT56336.1 alpha-E domain-containing protein [Truepera radiovictrix]